MLRASGIPWDLRKLQPYDAYDKSQCCVACCAVLPLPLAMGCLYPLQWAASAPCNGLPLLALPRLCFCSTLPLSLAMGCLHAMRPLSLTTPLQWSLMCRWASAATAMTAT